MSNKPNVLKMLDQCQPSQPGGLTCEVVTNAAGLESLRSFWEENNVHPEATFEFFLLIVKLRAEVEGPFVLVARQGSEIVSLLIGRVERSVVELRLGYCSLGAVRLRQVSFLTAGWCGRQTSEVAKLFVERVMEFLKKGGADRAQFCDLPRSGLLAETAGRLPPRYQRGFFPGDHDHWKAAIERSLDEYLGKKSGKQRWWLRKVLKGMEAPDGPKATVRLYRTVADMGLLARHAEGIAIRTYQRGLGVGFEDTKENRVQLELLAGRDAVRGFVLFSGEKPIAFWIGTVFRETWYSRWTGFLLEWKDRNPGTVILLRVIESLTKEGIREIDFGYGPAAYKSRLGTRNDIGTWLYIYAPSIKALMLNGVEATVGSLRIIWKKCFNDTKLASNVKRWWRRRLSASKDPESQLSGSGG